MFEMIAICALCFQSFWFVGGTVAWKKQRAIDRPVIDNIKRNGGEIYSTPGMEKRELKYLLYLRRVARDELYAQYGTEIWKTKTGGGTNGLH